jgi:hypothetical protein
MSTETLVFIQSSEFDLLSDKWILIEFQFSGNNFLIQFRSAQWTVSACVDLDCSGEKDERTGIRANSLIFEVARDKNEFKFLRTQFWEKFLIFLFKEVRHFAILLNWPFLRFGSRRYIKQVCAKVPRSCFREIEIIYHPYIQGNRYNFHVNIERENFLHIFNARDELFR